ncbi:MAG: hypothetical protein WCJ87_08315 [Burkholderiales bacterium]
MVIQFKKREVALAVIAALGTLSMSVQTESAFAASAGAPAGKYVSGDFHNHSTCSDGSLSMQKLVKKSTVTWGLDWFVQAGHGGNGNRNCTLTEDASLATPNFPFTNQGPTTSWSNSIGSAALKGLNASTSGNMWRWQSLQSFQYQVLEDLSVRKNVPLFLGLESVVAGHEHTSMSVITGQMPSTIDSLSNGTAVNAILGNANAHAQWSYCFDRGDTDNSRGTTNNWDCSAGLAATPALYQTNVTNLKYLTETTNAGASFDATTAYKITTNSGKQGHLKTVEAVKWMAANHGQGSYYIPAHLERAGPFNTAGSNGFNIEHLRNFNNAGPDVAFGFESQPGHGASGDRGEYYQCRNGGFTAIGGSPGCNANVQDTVGGTTYGGTGVYSAQVGGVWDALLGEGRKFWFFASSDWHNRGIFSADDRRSTQDFQPGEYQKTYAVVRNGTDPKLRPQTIVDGLRSGNAFASSGAIVDRLGYIACTGKTEAQAKALALAAAVANAPVDGETCANMGEKLTVANGASVVIAIAVRNPGGNGEANFSPYTFSNPSLLQVGITQPINMPVLNHVDLIAGDVVSQPKVSTDANYAGQWPSDWLSTTNVGYTGVSTAATAMASSQVPAAAKNLTTSVLSTFGSGTWTSTVGSDSKTYLVMAQTVTAGVSKFFRLRGSNLPANTPFETDASGNPLTDYYTNVTTTGQLRIPCTTTGTVPAVGTRTPVTGTISACPSHLPTGTILAGVNSAYPTGYTGKMSAYDVAAWSDLWFYSNPIYLQVTGSTTVAGVN